jgi:diacylglycerol kinase (ATP)
MARCGLDFELNGAVNVWILCNEDAGRGLSPDDVRTLVERAGHTVLGVAKRYDEQTPLPDGRLDLVVAAGGDGTVASGAAAAARTSASLALLPLGTANNIGCSLGVKASLPELIASWPSARRVPFDLGCARARSKAWLVVEGVGGGLMPAGIARAKAGQKQREEMTPTAEVAAAVRAFHDALVDLTPRAWTITIDGRRISDEFLLVEVLNIRSVGPNVVFAPDASPSDGYFDVILAQECHREELLTYFAHRAAGRDTRLALPRHRAREVVIAGCAELHIDDERVDARELGEISIRIDPAAITVLM